MLGWEKEKKWSDTFLDDIKPILGSFLISEAPTEEDMRHNTDLTVLTLGAVRVACRIRRYGYYQRFPFDITIRKSVPSGYKSEITKIIEGWGDFFFYGFSNPNETGLVAWRILDLNAFRIWHSRYTIINKGKLPGRLLNNDDRQKDSSFFAFDTRKFPDGIVCKEFGFSNIKTLSA